MKANTKDFTMTFKNLETEKHFYLVNSLKYHLKKIRKNVRNEIKKLKKEEEDFIDQLESVLNKNQQ